MLLNNRIFYFFLLATATILSSCIKESASYSEHGNHQLSINSISSTDGLWQVSLVETKSLFDDSPDYLAVKDANIRLENISTGQEIRFVHEKGARYKSIGHKPNAGDTYELFVESFKFGISRSRTYVPNIGEVTLEKSEERNIKGGSAINIDLSIKNVNSQTNFYVWEIIQEEEEDQDELATIKIFNEENIVHDNELLTPIGSTSTAPKGNGFQVFTNHDVDEEDISTSLIVAQATTADTQDSTSVFNNSFKIKIKAVSEDLYRYMQSVNEFTQNSTTHSNTYQPNIDNNIINGVGIFGAYHEKIVTVQ